MNRALDLKVDEAQGLSVQDSSEEKCAYCGQSELDMCSPLVVGQYRAEHESHLFLCRPTTADNFYADKTATAVKFCIYGEVCVRSLIVLNIRSHNALLSLPCFSVVINTIFMLL